MNLKKKTAILPCEFENDSTLTEVTLPSTVRSIGKYAFSGCSELRSLTLPDGITDVGANAFLDCKKLRFHLEGVCEYLGNAENPRLALISLFKDEQENFELILPDGVRLIAEDAFYYFTNLNKAILPSSLVSICQGAFYRCENLKEITLGKKIKSIGKNAFKGCDNLTDVYYEGGEEDWQKIKIAPGNLRLKRAKVHFNPTKK